jgi:cellulose biosynthesis protein BcsQ
MSELTQIDNDRRPTYWVGVYSQKGGVGKTNISVNLAHAMLKRLKAQRPERAPRVCYLDLDAQGTGTDWLREQNTQEHWMGAAKDLVAQGHQLQDLNLNWRMPLAVRPPLSDLVRSHFEGPGAFEAMLPQSLEEVPGIPGLYLIGNDLTSVTLMDDLMEFYVAKPEEERLQIKHEGGIAYLISQAFANLNGYFDVVICDCAPNVTYYVRAAFRMIRRMVIPMIADIPGIEGALRTRDALVDAKGYNPLTGIGAVVFNMEQQNNINKQARANAEILFGSALYPPGIKFQTAMRALPTPLPELGRGATVFDVVPSATDVADETRAAFLGLADRLLKDRPFQPDSRSAAALAPKPRRFATTGGN